jgi:type VI secretion system secreted protein Hcp
MPIYMKYDDGKIKGDVSSEGYKEQIEVSSFQWGMGRGVSTPVGSDSDRESSAPSVSEVSISKDQDKASIELMKAAMEGEGVTIVLTFCKTDAKKLEPFFEVTLHEAIISGYSLSSGGDRPSESISLNFTKVEFKAIPMKSKNETGDPKTFTYDLSKAAVV